MFVLCLYNENTTPNIPTLVCTWFYDLLSKIECEVRSECGPIVEWLQGTARRKWRYRNEVSVQSIKEGFGVRLTFYQLRTSYVVRSTDTCVSGFTEQYELAVYWLAIWLAGERHCVH